MLALTRRALAMCALSASCTVATRAQQGEPREKGESRPGGSGQEHNPQGKTQQKKTQQNKTQPPPEDDSDRAARVLRKLLGLEPTQELPPKSSREPSKPPPPPKKGRAESTPPSGPPVLDQQPQGQSPRKPRGKPGAKPTEDPVPNSGGAPIDETEAAAELLRDLLKGERPPIAPEPLDRSPSRTASPKDQGRPKSWPGRDEADEIGRLIRGLGATPDAPPESIPSDAAQSVFPIGGSLSTRYRGRHAAHAEQSDHDAVALLTVDLGDEDETAWSARIAGRAYYDFDGGRRPLFRGLEETYDHEFNARLYDAWVGLHDIDALRVVRFGRQTITDTPELIWLDGLRLETEPVGRARAWIGVHAGVPTHLFESTTDGDWLAGIAAGFEPWKFGEVRVDYLHIADERQGLELDDDLFGVLLRQQVHEIGNLSARFTMLNGDARDLELRGNGLLPQTDTTVQLSYRELLSTQRVLTTELDPYSSSAFDQDPYRQAGVRVQQQFGNTFALAGGFDLRRLADLSDERAFNREYERGYATASATDLFGGLASATLTADLWNTDGEDTSSLSGDLALQITSTSKATFASTYSLFEFDSFANRERAHVRTHTFRIDHRPSQELRFDVRYEYERDDIDEFHVVRAGVTWTF